MNTMKMIIIIGAGASGMMAAITARRAGAEVILIEHNDRVGKKILSTGNGRCNFTNIAQEPICYHSEEAGFPWQVIEQFTAQDTIRFFSELGIYSKNRNGYLYPRSDQASAVLDVLRMELEHLEIVPALAETIIKIEKQQARFYVQTETQRYAGDKLIVATGGKAAPKTGSDGSGYAYAKQFGHTIIPVVPALVQLRCAEKFYKNLAGIRVPGMVKLYVNDQLLAEDTGEIQLTNYGISGIPVFQISSYAARGLAAQKQVTAVIDFMPEFSVQDFKAFLTNRISQRQDKIMKDFFIGIFHKKLSETFLAATGIKNGKKAESLTQEEVESLCDVIKNFRTIVIGTNSFDQAQVCAGGVNSAELDPETLESRLVPGLHFAGELIDVDAICGGYNLQWAWSSGYAAGKGAAI